MIGIKGYASYLPKNRLDRSAIALAQGGRLPKGFKAVANFDEDALSMGVNAASSLLGNGTNGEIDELYFISLAKLYDDKLCSAIAATSLSLPKNVQTIDLNNTERALSQSFLNLMKAVPNSINNDALVIAANKQVGPLKSTIETYSGDGACAFCITDDEDVIANFVHSEAFYDDSYTHWKSDSQKYRRQWEDRFVLQSSLEIVDKGLKQLLEKQNIELHEFDYIIFSAPSPRLQTSFYRKYRQSFPFEELVENAGLFGAANGGMMLASCLETASPNEKILLIEYGDGCQFTILQTTEAIKNYKSPSPLKAQLEHRGESLNYLEYLRWNDVVPVDEGRRPNTVKMSVPAMKRNEKQRLTLEGSKCRSCNTPFYPKQRICAKCHAKDEMTPYSFLGKKAKLVTYAVDYLASSPAPPTIIGVVDFEGGGRMMVEMTDCKPDEVAIGKEVTFSFRHLHENEGINTYYWKAILKGDVVDE